MITLKVNQAALIHAVDRYMRDSRRSRKAVMTTQARGILKSLVSVTPPSGWNASTNTFTQGSSAKKAGERTILSDLHKIFTILSAKELARELKAAPLGYEQSFAHKGAKAIGTFKVKALTFSQMADWHKSHRTASGRARSAHRGATTGLKKSDMAGLDVGFVSATDFQKFYTEVKKKVGYLASGWKSSAQQLGVRLPAWVSRNSAPGACTIRRHIRASGS